MLGSMAENSSVKHVLLKVELYISYTKQLVAQIFFYTNGIFLDLYSSGRIRSSSDSAEQSANFMLAVSAHKKPSWVVAQLENDGPRPSGR